MILPELSYQSLIILISPVFESAEIFPAGFFLTILNGLLSVACKVFTALPVKLREEENCVGIIEYKNWVVLSCRIISFPTFPKP